MKRYTMNKRYCFFCVGTGGHIFPAKNLIKRLLESGVPEEDIIIVSDKRGVKYFEDMTVEIIQKEFYISTRGIFGYLVNIGQFIRTIWEVYKELKTEKINTVLTTGAYIAPYAALISLILRSEFYIQEQNQYAGLGNRVASYFPSTVFESFPETKNLNRKNTLFTGPILNIDTKKMIEKNTNRNFTIGIQGGSQGSEEINQFIYKFIDEFDNYDVEFLHITGPMKANTIKFDKSFYRQVEFFYDMNDYYQSVDFQISRAGGGILEAAYLNIPQLLIPFKHGTTASHQTLNANYLEKNGNAKVVVEYKEFSELIHNICKYKFSYLDENFTSYQIKVGNDDIFKIISESNYE